MKVYMVERDLHGISLDALADAQKAAIGKAEEMTARGSDIRYLRSTFAPADGRCMCLFEAPTESVVRKLNDEAGLPYQKIVEAYDLSP